MPLYRQLLNPSVVALCAKVSDEQYFQCMNNTAVVKSFSLQAEAFIRSGAAQFSEQAGPIQVLILTYESLLDMTKVQ